MIPPKLAAQHDRSIVFLGNVANTQTTFMAEISSLWTIAYLEGLLPDNDLTGNRETVDKEIALTNTFVKRRYPGRKNMPVAVLEIYDWMDIMLKDLGVRTDRNRLACERTHRQEFGLWG